MINFSLNIYLKKKNFIFLIVVVAIESNIGNSKLFIIKQWEREREKWKKEEITPLSKKKKPKSNKKKKQKTTPIKITTKFLFYLNKLQWKEKNFFSFFFKTKKKLFIGKKRSLFVCFFFIFLSQINSFSMFCFSVSICDFIWEPSFCMIEQAMTGRDTPHALPNPIVIGDEISKFRI